MGTGVILKTGSLSVGSKIKDMADDLFVGGVCIK